MTPAKKDLFVENPDGSYRAATEEEILQSMELRMLREDLSTLEQEVRDKSAKCQHVVVYDTMGFPFDVRTCLACGRLEMI